ncbi:MAG TPA: sigma-70 family RNA polymerase sigma factor [Verrucomicrobiae bacterium]|nr:sigma-70 family RNA polymerase sigma factor [Verrucomicrobiae bacterium]
MKNTFKRNHHPRTTRLTPRVRLTPPRMPRRRHVADALPPTAEIKLAKQSSSTEPSPAEAHRGDALQLYLREIGQVKLLTPAEELTLARRVKRGDKRAREQMIKANLRLVVKIARDYEGLGLPLLDLINEGNIGLMKGVERFNPNKGVKLSSYASWWIKQGIKRALANQSRTIRLPVHVVDKVAHIRRAETRLREALDHEPSDEELAHELDLDPRRVRRYRQASRAPVSLDASIGDEDSNSISEVVPDANAALPSDHLVRETDTDLVREILATMPERERVILSLRFGLAGSQVQTLEEVGKRFRLTRERIRQIQEQALLSMRKKMEERDQPRGEAETEMSVVA